MFRVTKQQLNKQLFETVLDKNNNFISEEEKNGIKDKFNELGIDVGDLNYEDWNYILSAVKDRDTSNITLTFAKNM